jgi:hypothetical protein
VIERVGRDVERELSRFGSVATLAPLVDAWPAAVGSEIARNAWPARVARDGTLHVHTSSSAWAFELGQLEDRIRHSLGDLAPTRLRFAVGPLPEPTADDVEADARKAIRPSPAHAEKAAEITAEMVDENLRKIVAKAATLSLAKADSDR